MLTTWTTWTNLTTLTNQNTLTTLTDQIFIIKIIGKFVLFTWSSS